jgi:hypothetical protein
MSSRLDDIVSLIAARYNDTAVSFEAGKVKLNKNAQQRKIILVRQDGQLRFSAAPDRARFSTPVAGVGETTKQPFERFETVEATLRAEDEDDLDQMFDRFVNSVFECFGPAAFENVNEYAWFQGDSSTGGDWARRNPAIKLTFRVRLRSVAQPGPFAVLAEADATLALANSAGATGPTADDVRIITP